MILRRIALLSVCVLALASTACGFHPRGTMTIPANIGPVKVVAAARYTTLYNTLVRALAPANKAFPQTAEADVTTNAASSTAASSATQTTKAGPSLPADANERDTLASASQTGVAQMADAPTTTATSNDAKSSGPKTATLRILSEAFRTDPLSVDAFAHVHEYIVTYVVKFNLTAPDGSLVMPAQEVRLQRDFSYDINHALGAGSEQDTINNDLQREMAETIIRRVDISLRNFRN
jgi:outer membrane lipopolysaccharide assembly protein LptE/RlpB